MTIEEMKKRKSERGYSMTQLSEYSGVPIGTLQKIFSGESKNPRNVTLTAIEKVLNSEEKTYPGKAFVYQQMKELPDSLVMEVCEFGESRKKDKEYTIEDYLNWPEEQRIELIDGVIYDMAAPLTIHQLLIGEIFLQIKEYIKKNNEDCVPAFAPVDVHLDCDNRTMVQPDILIVCNPDKIRDSEVYGAPDFVLEVLSPSTRKKDMTIKLAKYATAGVREYWIVDPEKKTVITYDLEHTEGMPVIHSFQEKIGLTLYDSKMMIDFEEIETFIKRFG